MAKARSSSVINVLIAGDTKKFKKALGRAGGSLADFSKKVGQVGLAAGAAFAGIGAKSIGLAVDFEESLSKANQIFGDAAKGIETSAKGAASAVGLSQAEFLEAASSFGVFGKAAGLTGDDLSTFSTDLVTLSADVASFNNLKPEDALAKLNAGLRGSVEPLQSIGGLMTAAAVEAEGLNMGLIEQGEKLSEGQKIMARHRLIMQQLGSQGATGDFARTSEGLANTQRILNARLKNLGITLGRVLLPIAEKMADWIGRLITKFEEWTPALKNAANAVVDFLTPVKETVNRWLPIVANWLKDVIADTVIPALVTAFNTVKDVITDKVIPVFKEIYNTVAPALVTAFNAVKDAITDNVIPAIEDLIEWSQDKIPAAFDATIEHIKKYKDEYIALGAAIGGVVVAIGLLKAAIAVSAAFKAAAAGITALFALMASPLLLAALAIAVVVGTITYLALKSESFRNTLGGMWDFFLDKIKEVKRGVELTIDLIQKLIDLIKKIPDIDPVKMADPTGGGIVDALTNPALGVAKGIQKIWPFANGGIVTQPTLGLIGEAGPEAVIPLNQMGAMGTTNITVNMPAGADGNDIVAALEAYVRRNGSIPLATNNLVRK